MTNILKSNKKSILICGILASMLIFHGTYLYCLIQAKSVLLVAALLTVVFACFSYLYIKNRISLEFAFASILFIMGLCFCAVFTPGTVPDEGYHFDCSYYFANSFPFLPVSFGEFTMRAEDAELARYANSSHCVSGQSYRDTASMFSLVSTNSELVTVDPFSSNYNLSNNPPQLKLASALGIVVAKILNLGAVPLYYLGRIFNLAFFVILATIAVAITPKGKAVFIAASFLPMTLHLVSSYSYDSGTIGLSFIVISLFIKTLYSEKPISKKTKCAIIVTSALLVPCKVVYSLVILLFLLIPSRNFNSKKEALAFKTALIACMICVLAIFSCSRLISLMFPSTEISTEAIIDNPSSRGYTLSELIENPLQGLYLYIYAIQFYGDFYLKGIIGGSLGWFQDSIASSQWIIYAYTIILFISTMETREDRTTLKASFRIIAITTVALVWLAIMTSMAIGWTTHTNSAIEGVQGRYLLPVLPLLLFACKTHMFRFSGNLNKTIILSFLFLNFIYLERLYAYALMTVV